MSTADSPHHALVECGGNRPLPGTYVFTGERSRRGYRLNQFAMSMIEPERREAFRRDEKACMQRFGLSAEEQEMVRLRDWHAMIRHGGNIYLMLKVAGALNVSLLAMGAQMRGESLEAFMATRPAAKAQPQRSGRLAQRTAASPRAPAST